MSQLLHAITARAQGRLTKSLGVAGIWQITNYIIPLATVPYLSRTLGPSHFGILGLSMALAAYATLLTDWGFGYSGVQSAAKLRGRPAELSALTWSVIGAKLCLAIPATLFVWILCLFAFPDPLTRQAVLVSLLAVLGSVFAVDWLLRGVDRLKEFAISSIVGRTLAIPLIFIFVRTPADVVAAALCQAVTVPVTAALMLVAARRAGLVGFPRLSPADIRDRLADGALLFFTTAIVSLYTNSLAVILGMFSTPFQLGQFNGAEKIRRPIQSMLQPVGMVFFPHISHLIAQDPERARQVARKVLWLQAGTALIMTVGTIAAAPLLVRVLLGPGFEEAVPVLRIMALCILLIGINGVLAVIIMLPLGLKRAVTLCVSAGAVVGVTLSVPLAIAYGAAGVAAAAVAAELAVTISTYVTLRRGGHWR